MEDAKNASSSRSSGNRRRNWARRLRLAALVSAALLGYQAWETLRYAESIMPPPNAEIAIVLGARSAGPEPLPVFRERIEHAIGLFSTGKVSKILFTGAPGNPPQAIVGRDFALARGVPETAILLETRSRITIENLRFAKEFLPSPQTPVLIVSDPLHLRRAMRMAEDLGLNASPAAVPESRVRSRWSRAKMTLRESAAYWKYLILRWL